MGQIVEVVFESVAPNTAATLLHDVIATSSDVRGIDVDGKSVSSGASARELVGSGASCVSVRLSDATMGCRLVPNVGLRLLKTGDDCYDVEVNLDLDDVDEPSTIASALHDFARDLARRNDVASYFAGLEPAADEDTRIFTGETQGPLRFLK
ncbi:hypothetical protein [Nannocystis punicea]|uniref:Uncharacterized protein n=1 Tax=Nannocystis punicea TaxID=2995304 RepID=A0ABY7HBG6_9BACT|nr:hypothetical protein [Nannocystis poenicansa]WAS96430.1 hypothetical protein O0S08_09750 [Nannocystis poenicansa]